jgi:hypothetical protein
MLCDPEREGWSFTLYETTGRLGRQSRPATTQGDGAAPANRATAGGVAIRCQNEVGTVGGRSWQN